MTPGRTPAATGILGVVAVATAVYFGFAFSGTSLWLDEAYSVLVAKRSWAEIVAQLRVDNGPPLYYWLLSIWIALFGDAERTVRGLSGLAYLATGPVIFVAARRAFGSTTAGVVAATLFWISPLAVRHTFSARMYALLGLFTAASIALFLRELDAPSRRLRVGAWVLNVAGLFLQYWFGFVLLAQAIAYLLVSRRRARVSVLLWLTTPVVPFALLWGPVLRDQLRSGGSAWIEPVGVGALVTTFLDFYGGWIAILAFAAFTGVLLVRREKGRLRWRTRSEWRELSSGGAGAALVVICVASVLVPWLVSLAKPIYFVGRYTLIALVPFVLVVGGALARALGSKTALLVFPLLILRLLATTGDQLAWARRDAKESSRTSAARILERAQPGAQVLFTGLGGVTLRYYLDRSGRPWSTRTFPAELDQHPGWMQPERMLENAEALRREAAQVVQSLGPAEVWHVQTEGDPIAAMLEEALVQARGAATREEPLPGSFHDFATVYPADPGR